MKYKLKDIFGLQMGKLHQEIFQIIGIQKIINGFPLLIYQRQEMYSNEAIMAFHDKHIVEILPEYIFYMFKYRNWEQGSNKAVLGKTLNKAM